MDLETKGSIKAGDLHRQLSPAPWARRVADQENTTDNNDIPDVRPSSAESQPQNDDDLEGEVVRQVIGKHSWPPAKTDMKMQTKVAKAAHAGKAAQMRKGYAKKVKKAYTTDSGDALPAWCPKFCQNFFNSLAKYHLVISILAEGPHGMFTRPQRATVATSVLLLEMAGAAVATRYLDCDAGQAVYYGIGSAMLCAPLAYALAKLFVVTGQKYRESGAFLRDFAVQKKRQHAGDPTARAKLAQMIAHDKELAERAGRAKCSRCMRNRAGKLMFCYDWTSRNIGALFRARHEDDDLRSSASTRSATPTFNVGASGETDMFKRKQAELTGLSDRAAGLRGQPLPPEATYRYYLWRWLHHAIYCCCFLVAVTAAFNVIFYGMKFDEKHVQCWFTGCICSIATDYLILQPLVALLRLHSDRRTARQQKAQLAVKRAAVHSTIAFRDQSSAQPQKTEWTADDFGA